MNEQRKFLFKSSAQTLYWVMGVVMSGLGIAGLIFFGAMGILLGVGIVFIVVALWQRNRAVITFHDDHLEMKVAPAARKWMILYKDIKAIESKSLKAGRIKIVQNGNFKHVKLPFGFLEESDWQALFSELEKRTGLPIKEQGL